MNDKLKKQAFGLMIGLLVQYLLGIVVNLFVSFPEDVHGEELWKFTEKQPLILIHILLALLLLIGSSAFVSTSIKQKNSLWIKVSLVAFLSILLSVITGALFVPSQNDTYSVIMASGFAVAAASYGWGLFKSNQKSSKIERKN